MKMEDQTLVLRSSTRRGKGGRERLQDCLISLPAKFAFIGIPMYVSNYPNEWVNVGGILTLMFRHRISVSGTGTSQ